MQCHEVDICLREAIPPHGVPITGPPRRKGRRVGLRVPSVRAGYGATALRHSDPGRAGRVCAAVKGLKFMRGIRIKVASKSFFFASRVPNQSFHRFKQKVGSKSFQKELSMIHCHLVTVASETNACLLLAQLLPLCCRLMTVMTHQWDPI